MTAGAVAPGPGGRPGPTGPLGAGGPLRLLLLVLVAATAENSSSPLQHDGGPGTSLGTPARRAAAVSVEFSLDEVVGSSIGAVARSAAYVDVRAGVQYPLFQIHAASGLGFEQPLIQAKLVRHDLPAAACADAVAEVAEPPFNGAPAVANPNPEETLNKFPNAVFPRSGRFRLCYSARGTAWELLPPEIAVLGSGVNSNKVWCVLSNLLRVECTDAVIPEYCYCRGKIEGFRRNSQTGVLQGLGLPEDPGSPAFRAMLFYSDAECATVGRHAEPFVNKASQPIALAGYEVQDFGLRKPGAELGVWRLCYCAGIDADTSAAGGTCFSEAQADFPQLAGQLATIWIKTKQAALDVTVYPILRFNVVLECGSDGVVRLPNSLIGACSSSLDARYRIVDRSVLNDRAYYDSEAGCRSLPQAVTTQDGAKINGGQIRPDNCQEPTRCLDVPEVPGPMTPTWQGVQLDATYQNHVMIRGEYDVCYCEGDCGASANWFKAGVFNVRPVRTFFTTELDNSNRVAPVVNTRAYLVIEGPNEDGPGSWSTESDGRSTREMKLLRDCPGCVDKLACLETEMPDVISGHRLISGNTDFTEPETLRNGAGRTTGQRYGKICNSATPPACVPNLRIADAGWYAICYCDSNCNEYLNWAVVDRIIVAGPLQGQTWTQYGGVTFNIDVRGSALGILDRLMILSPAQVPADCGAFPQSAVVNGPSGVATLLARGTRSAIVTNMVWDSRGTEITFITTHGLVDGDRISLTGVNVPAQANLNIDTDMGIKMSAMYNRVHEVFRQCDDAATGCHKIMIPVKFPQAEFPFIELGSVVWTRNSVETFTRIKVKHGLASPEGRGYVVCWSSEGTALTDHVGQAGTLTIKNPVEMPEAHVGLTTVMPDTVAPLVISFMTGDIAHYAEMTNAQQMHLVIAIMPGTPDGGSTYMNVMEPRTRGLNDLTVDEASNDVGDASQAFCGQIFLELWSSDPAGFPMPDGCWYDEDFVDPDYVIGGRGLRQLHILFSPRNHLKKQTRYMLVMNMNVKPELTATFPDTGAVWIWSMDDVHANPFNVIELGRAYASPTTRVPPRDATGALMLNTGDDPRFDDANGFIVRGDAGNAGVRELTGHCKAYDPRRPEASPLTAFQCIPCRSEEDCGNGGNGVPPNPAYTFCVSPIEISCQAVAGDILNVPAFTFDIKAKTGHPIVRSSILRLFLHPLTQWNIESSCRISMDVCQPPALGGTCGISSCASEMVIGGPVLGVNTYPINIIKITFPAIMGDIADAIVNTFKVGNLPVPFGGFFPEVITAELMKADQTAPDYWGPSKVGGAKLYVQPKVLAAALVTHIGEGNAKPFRGDQGNKLYARLVLGATLWARAGESVRLAFQLPSGYVCTTPNEGGTVPELPFLLGSFPNQQGRLGGKNGEIVWVRRDSTGGSVVACEIQYRVNMITYARAPMYVEMTVDNPATPLPATAAANEWKLIVTNDDYGALPPYVLGARELAPCSGDRPNYLCHSDLSVEDYGGNVSVLGKLTETILAPSNFGVSERNRLSLFLRTEQSVGTLQRREAELWVDAPATFDFGVFCVAADLPDIYYIPEGKGTQRLPTADIIVCRGAKTDAAQATYNRAKVSTTGRLLQGVLYGFQLEVVNTPRYTRWQLDEWRIWTYTTLGSVVDGTFETPRFNERDAPGASMSYGTYLGAMPSGNFMVSVADLFPTLAGAPATEITVFPIVVTAPATRPVRVLAPAGFVWSFEPHEFKTRPAGAERDMPIAGVPAKPTAEPLNRLVMDSIVLPGFEVGVKYGFAAKVIVPKVGPTGSANQFTIEFGYSEELGENRTEAGVVQAPVVRRLINGRVTSTSAVQGRGTEVTFSIQTVSDVPTAGAIFIIGPPGYGFASLCQTKPALGFPELPYDSTCLFEVNTSTARSQITIVAGPSGIRAGHYTFSIAATNPTINMAEGEYSWNIFSYKVANDRLVRNMLDFNTTIPGLAVGFLMREAGLRMPPWTQCFFRTLEQQIADPSQPVTYCDFERWQFYPPMGHRNDRPGMENQLIFMMQLEFTNPGTVEVLTKELIVRAPAGYEFNTDCGVVAYPSSRIFNDTATDGVLQAMPETLTMDPDLLSPTGVPYTTLERRFDQRYATWPEEATILGCKGRGNEARITVSDALAKYRRYLFRLSVLRNPVTTPKDNRFVLEYSGESSEAFEGIKIWAFDDGLVLPTTTAASLRQRDIENEVTVHLRPINDLPAGGHLRITAPSGFVLATRCSVAVAPHATDAAVAALAGAVGVQRTSMLKYMEFQPGEVECHGDETPSSQCRLHFANGGRYLRRGVLYTFKITVVNPQTTSAFPDPWLFQSFRDLTVSDLIDSASFPGFRINSAMEDFAYLAPQSNNALVKHPLTFNMSFPGTVEVLDTITIVAPVSFFFNEPGDVRCHQYVYLEGALRGTVPRCGANTVTWQLQQNSIPALSRVRFSVQVMNPPANPTINLFQVLHRGPDGVRRSSRTIPGFDIIPRLEAVSIRRVSPPTPCRDAVTVVTGQICEGAGSTGSVEFRFTPTRAADVVRLQGRVAGEAFALLKASFAGAVATFARSETAIAAAVSLRAGVPVTLLVEGVLNPASAGSAVWSITTYALQPLPGVTTTTTLFAPFPCSQGGPGLPCGAFPGPMSRRDESVDLPTFEVLGYIQGLSESRVNPVFYGALAAMVTFEMKLSYSLLADDIVRVTRPPSYRMIGGSLTAHRGLQAGEQGLDFLRRFSTDFANPEDYYFSITRPPPPLEGVTTLVFSLQADLPAIPQSSTNWFFRTYRVLPLLDSTDGEVIEGGAVPYPWIGRQLQGTGTNDGASSTFTGFVLVGQVPFTISPMLQTPGADNALTLNMNLVDGVEAAAFVRVEVIAPQGFLFRDLDCFYVVSTEFQVCTGFRNVATLKSSARFLKSPDITVRLAVKNPDLTPQDNNWYVAVFKDDETQYVRWFSVLGYTILSLRVGYKGNNKLDESASGFFTFTPVRASPSALVYMIITPPPGAGFRLACTGVSPLGFGTVSQCTSGGANGSLTLRFDNASIVAEKAYTFGIPVTNPTVKPQGSLNYWGLTLKDNEKLAFDGNLRIPALELSDIPLRCEGLGWTSATPRTLGTVLVQLRVTFIILGGTISDIIIVAPDGIMYNEDPGALKVIPLPLPLSTARPVAIGGTRLTLNLDQGQDINPGLYNIRFDVSNPKAFPFDNTWSVLVMKDVDILVSHVFTGYADGQVSPIDLATTVGLAGSAPRTFGRGLLAGALALFASFASGARRRSG